MSDREHPHGNGYIRMYRKLLTSSVFENPRLLKVWIWCLIRANWREASCLFERGEIKLDAGQFITGRFTGSKECRMNPSTFYDCLKKLELIGNIRLKSDNKKTLVTVVKYSSYQSDTADEWQQSNNKATTEQQQSNTDKNIISKEEKKESKAFAPRKSAVDEKELTAKDFVLRLDDAEFQIFKTSVSRLIVSENQGRVNPFRWQPSDSELKTLIYKTPDADKISILQNAYKVLGEKINWSNYVLKCIQLMIRSSEKRVINSPVGFMIHLLGNPQSVISEISEGKIPGSVGRGKYA